MEKTKALAILSALAQETRLDIFRLLVQVGPSGIPAGQIGEKLDLPAATLSFHLKELRGSGVVVAERRGRSILYAADCERMRALLDYLSLNCCRGLDS